MMDGFLRLTDISINSLPIKQHGRIVEGFARVGRPIWLFTEFEISGRENKNFLSEQRLFEVNSLCYVPYDLTTIFVLNLMRNLITL